MEVMAQEIALLETLVISAILVIVKCCMCDQRIYFYECQAAPVLCYALYVSNIVQVLTDRTVCWNLL